MNLVSFQEKCQRQGYGGFVVEPAAEDGLVKVFFKPQKAQSLASLRRLCPKRSLHVRPTGRLKRGQVGTALHMHHRDIQLFLMHAYINVVLIIFIIRCLFFNIKVA